MMEIDSNKERILYDTIYGDSHNNYEERENIDKND